MCDALYYATAWHILSGPSSGFSVVDVFGRGFEEDMSCWFDDIATQAIFMAEDHIQCQTSPIFVKESEHAKVTTFAVTKSQTPPESRHDTLNFTYYSHPPRLSLRPTHGVTTGGTEVRIASTMLAGVLQTLERLGVHLEPMCKFGGIAVLAAIEQEELVCTSPQVENKSNSTEAVQVSVSLSGKDFVSTQKRFHYYLPPLVHSVYPEIVPVGEHTELVIRLLSKHKQE